MIQAYIHKCAPSLDSPELPRVAENADTGGAPTRESVTGRRHRTWPLAYGTAGVGLGGMTERASTAKPRACGELCADIKHSGDNVD